MSDAPGAARKCSLWVPAVYQRSITLPLDFEQRPGSLHVSQIQEQFDDRTSHQGNLCPGAGRGPVVQNRLLDDAAAHRVRACAQRREHLPYTPVPAPRARECSRSRAAASSGSPVARLLAMLPRNPFRSSGSLNSTVPRRSRVQAGSISASFIRICRLVLVLPSFKIASTSGRTSRRARAFSSSAGQTGRRKRLVSEAGGSPSRVRTTLGLLSFRKGCGSVPKPRLPDHDDRRPLEHAGKLGIGPARSEVVAGGHRPITRLLHQGIGHGLALAVDHLAGNCFGPGQDHDRRQFVPLSVTMTERDRTESLPGAHGFSEELIGEGHPPGRPETAVGSPFGPATRPSSDRIGSISIDPSDPCRVPAARCRHRRAEIGRPALFEHSAVQRRGVHRGDGQDHGFGECGRRLRRGSLGSPGIAMPGPIRSSAIGIDAVRAQSGPSRRIGTHELGHPRAVPHVASTVARQPRGRPLSSTTVPGTSTPRGSSMGGGRARRFPAAACRWGMSFKTLGSKNGPGILSDQP